MEMYRISDLTRGPGCYTDLADKDMVKTLDEGIEFNVDKLLIEDASSIMFMPEMRCA